jgi:hypothetical protein
MVFEIVTLINALCQVSAGIFTLLLAMRLGKDKIDSLKRPFYLLSGVLLMLSVLNIAWSLGLIGISSLDNSIVLPLINILIMGIWFYICLVVSGHVHIYYLLPLFVMSINTMLIFSNLVFVCDLIAGLVLVGAFFHLEFTNHATFKRISYFGMAYGGALIIVSLVNYLSGMQYVKSFWFIPYAFLSYIAFSLFRAKDLYITPFENVPRQVPLALEVVKLGLFVVGLSIFIMLGTLGVHELGHSLVAKTFGCSTETVFDIGFAKTHVVCDSTTGSTLIALGGFALTMLISLVIYMVGNDFAKRMSFMMFAFSFIISSDDFIVLKLPYSLMIIALFVTAILVAYGLVRIVQEYELEYDAGKPFSSLLNYERESYLNQNHGKDNHGS